MLTEETPRDAVSIACNLNAIPADTREQWSEAIKLVYASVQEIQDLPPWIRISPATRLDNLALRTPICIK